MEREAYLHKERAPILDRPVAACMLCGQAGKDIFEAHICTIITGQEILSQNPSQLGFRSGGHPSYQHGTARV